jgi:hypothetical protein
MITLLLAIITRDVGLPDDRWALISLGLDLIVETIGIVLIVKTLL